MYRHARPSGPSRKTDSGRHQPRVNQSPLYIAYPPSSFGRHVDEARLARRAPPVTGFDHTRAARGLGATLERYTNALHQPRLDQPA